MLGTLTYPLAVKLARSKRLLRLRNFYAIHACIAPFLALIHANFFSFVQTLLRIRLMEQEFAEARPRYEEEF